jgi:T5SS/PEP-CTERM-associated repeat protein
MFGPRRIQVWPIIVAAAMLLAGSAGPTRAAVTATGDFSPDPLMENQFVEIGSFGYGTFRIDGGSTFESDFIELGGSQPGFGVATVIDAGSKWTIDGGQVGGSGVGRLEIRQGGVVESTSGGGLRLGDNSPGHGTVIVTGPSSLLHVNGQFLVGQNGAGVLEIAADAIVNVPTSTTIVGGNGRVKLDGGLLRTNDFENRGIISGSGEIDVLCCGQLENLGRIEAGASDYLLLRSLQSNGLTNRGELIADGGELEIHHRLSNENSGETQGQITLHDGTIRVGVIGGGQQFPSQLTNRGLVAVIGGTNHIYGTVENEFMGQIAVTNNSLAMFHHDVFATNNSTISVFAGSTAIFLQDLELNGGTLLADLTGVAGFGHVEVVGDVFLNGMLQVSLSNDFAPQAGDSFPLLTAAGGIEAQSLLLDAPELPDGLDWRLQVGANQVVVSVVTPTIAGDYNGNGVVDAADYTVWRDLLGKDGIALAADGTGSGGGLPDGVVDQFDYDLWVEHFGETADGGEGSAANAPGDSPGANHAVPEPSVWVLLTFGAALVVVGRQAMSRR